MHSKDEEDTYYELSNAKCSKEIYEEYEKAEKEWRNGWNHEELIAFGAEKQLEWKFIGSSSQCKPPSLLLPQTSSGRTASPSCTPKNTKGFALFLRKLSGK